MGKIGAYGLRKVSTHVSLRITRSLTGVETFRYLLHFYVSEDVLHHDSVAFCIKLYCMNLGLHDDLYCILHDGEISSTLLLAGMVHMITCETFVERGAIACCRYIGSVMS